MDPSGFADPGRPRFCARCGAAMDERDHGDRRRPVCPACGWTYYAKNALGAAVLIERTTNSAGSVPEILLVQRAHDPYRGDWMLPAGFVEYGEDAAATAAREAAEECSLTVRVGDVFGLYFGTDDPRNPSYLIVYHASVTDPGQQPTAGDDACAAVWFPAEHLPPNIAFEAHRRALADWARERHP